MTGRIVRSVRSVTKKTLITKLSPNVTDITEIAQSAVEAGTDALALINTVSGMSIDINKRTSRLSMLSGGLSGPAIRPIAVRMVWEVYSKLKVPIIGMGGICDTSSALEFLIAGAAAVSIGTANFVDPAVSIEVIRGIQAYLRKNSIPRVRDLTGSLKI
jgi:dihydroorotate dehydrogenase (NAD+) catalytic subunit